MKLKALALLFALATLSTLPSCAPFTKRDAAEYAIIAAEGALDLAKARLVAEAVRPGADPLKIAALQTAVLMAERALEKAKERLAAPPVLTSSK